MDTIRSSWWSITLNNPTEEDRQTVKGPPPRWLKMIKGQEEVGENGTHHLQMVANTEQIRASQLKAWLPRSHIEAPKSQKHKENLINYVHKDETAVANSRFEIRHREEQHNLTMASVMTLLGELAWTQERMKEEIDKRAADGKKFKLEDLYKDEFWEAVNIIVADQENLISVFTQTQYLTAWIRTRKVWIAKVEVDRQTQLSIGEATKKLSDI